MFNADSGGNAVRKITARSVELQRQYCSEAGEKLHTPAARGSSIVGNTEASDSGTLEGTARNSRHQQAQPKQERMKDIAGQYHTLHRSMCLEADESGSGILFTGKQV